MKEEKEYFECPACDQVAAYVMSGASGIDRHGNDVDITHNFCDCCGHDWWD